MSNLDQAQSGVRVQYKPSEQRNQRRQQKSGDGRGKRQGPSYEYATNYTVHNSLSLSLTPLSLTLSLSLSLSLVVSITDAEINVAPIPSYMPGVGENIAMHASPAVRNSVFLFPVFPVQALPLHLFFFHIKYCVS